MIARHLRTCQEMGVCLARTPPCQGDCQQQHTARETLPRISLDADDIPTQWPDASADTGLEPPLSPLAFGRLCVQIAIGAAFAAAALIIGAAAILPEGSATARALDALYTALMGAWY
jgi:hypothetical protein